MSAHIGEEFIEIRTKVPAAMWFAFAERAEARGLDVGLLLAQLIGTEATASGPELTASVLRLHHSGLTIPLIARRLHTTNQDVSRRLYSAGLRGNKATTATRALMNEARDHTNARKEAS